MKIFPDGKGKLIIDFEGIKIDCSATEKENLETFIVANSLFDNNLVSEIRNAIFIGKGTK